MPSSGRSHLESGDCVLSLSLYLLWAKYGSFFELFRRHKTTDIEIIINAHRSALDPQAGTSGRDRETRAIFLVRVSLWLASIY